jgi:hypothetical protein
MKYQDTEKLHKAIGVMLSRIDEPLPKLPKPKWYDSVRKWELLLLAWKRGVISEREQTIKLLNGHKQTTKSVSGFLGVCSCGEPVDDYSEHLITLIRGEK